MKNIFITTLIFLLTFSNNFAYSLSQDEQGIGDTLSEVILGYDDSYRDVFYERIQDIIESQKYSERVNAILNYVLVNILLGNNTYSNNKELLVETEEEEEEEITIENTGANNIDLDIVKNNWLSWNNEVRNDLGLDEYSFSSQLESSALIWSEYSKNIGDITHIRNSGDGYYNYNAITSWFADNGVVCQNISGITHTENIGWGTYSCSDGECTDELSTATQSTFDYYMSEKSYNGAHYRSLTQPYFTEIGLGISVEETSQNKFKYYLTIHYCTALVD